MIEMAEKIEEGRFVTPGERLSTEEEYAPSRNTYSEDGVIYASTSGFAIAKNGYVEVKPIKNVEKIRSGMLVIGTVVDDMKNVIFVRIDGIRSENKEYLALKDGKILISRPRPQFGRGRDRFGGGREGDRNERREGGMVRESFQRGRRPPMEREEKPCKTGDTILAKIIGEENDIYVLGLGAPEAGVIYANCSVCSNPMNVDERTGALVCSVCKHVDKKKVSIYYNNPQEIKKLVS